MIANGAARCMGEGCTHRAVIGASYCSEDHYDELVAERKSRNGYRTAVPPPADDYTKALKPAIRSDIHVSEPKDPPAPKTPKPTPMTTLSLSLVSDDDLRLLRNGGFGYKEIGARYGVKWTVIAYRCQKLGLGGERAHTPHKEKLAEIAQTFEAVSPLDDDLPNVKLKAEVMPDAPVAVRGPQSIPEPPPVMAVAGTAAQEPQLDHRHTCPLPGCYEPSAHIAADSVASTGPQLLWQPAITAARGMNHFDKVIEDLEGQIAELQMIVDLLKKHKVRA